MTRKRASRPPRLRVVVQIGGDDPLFFDFNLKRKPTVKRVRRVMDAFNGSLSNARTPSLTDKTSTK
jgi:hypothetical protein